MADTLTLTLQPRTILGKKVKSLRKAGIIPVHLYGQSVNPQALQCDGKTLLRVIAQSGMNTPISVHIEDQEDERLTFVREIQWDPKRGDLIHVDFLHVDVSDEITAAVPITLTGEAPGARLVANATVVQVLREVEVRSLPLDIPSGISVSLEIIAQPEDVIRVSDLSLPPNVLPLIDTEEVIARLEISRVEVGSAESGEDPGIGLDQGDEQSSEASPSS